MQQALCPKCGKRLRTQRGLGWHLERSHAEARQDMLAQNHLKEAETVCGVVAVRQRQRIMQENGCPVNRSPFCAAESQKPGLCNWDRKLLLCRSLGGQKSLRSTWITCAPQLLIPLPALFPSLALQWGQASFSPAFRCWIVTVSWAKSTSSTSRASAFDGATARVGKKADEQLVSRKQTACSSIRTISGGSR